MNLSDMHHERIVDALSVACPAVRMVVVTVSVSDSPIPGDDFLPPPDDDGFYVWVNTYPALALVATAERHYSRPRRGPVPPALPPTHRQAEEAGWIFGQHLTYYDVLVQTEEYGICPALEAFDAANEVHRVVLCLWPESEDEIRLASTIAELTDEAKVQVGVSHQIERESRTHSARA